MMRVRKRGSSRLVISAIPLPETSPPAHPCTPRAAISEPMSGTSAQHTVPSEDSGAERIGATRAKA